MILVTPCLSFHCHATAYFFFDFRHVLMQHLAVIDLKVASHEDSVYIAFASVFQAPGNMR